MKSKKLTVLMMAYNQGQYIDEAIKSVFNQNIEFEWELLIGDDCSTDNTKEIVKKWIALNPEHIHYFQHKQNIGLHSNYTFLVQKSQGEFIALLEADDYWIDPKKTKEQIAFMEKNPNIAWSFTNGDITDQYGNVIEEVRHRLPKIFNLDYYLSHFFNPLNNTIIFRKAAEPREYPDFFYGIIQWDTVLHYLRAMNGEIGFLPLNGMAWRRHINANSLSDAFGNEKRYFDWVKINKGIKLYISHELHHYFNVNYVAYEFLSIYNLKKKNYIRFSFFLIKMIFNKPMRPHKEYRDLFYKLRKSL
jgi:glycosyltransferase involved in cell wall biosynthesis